MAGIVPSLFGPTPEDLMSLKRKEEAQLIQNAGQIYGAKGATGAAIGSLLGKGINKLFGLEDPEVKKATDVYGILKSTQQGLGADAADPTKLYPALQEAFTTAGYGDLAQKVAEEGQTKILDWNIKQADISAKTDKLKREQLASQVIINKETELGRPLTDQELIDTTKPFLTNEERVKTAGFSQERALKEELKLKDLEIKYAQNAGKMTDKEKLDYEDKLKKEFERFKVSLKGGNQTYKTYDTLTEKLNDNTYGVLQGDQPAKEKTIARRIGTDAKEVTQGIEQMMTLTKGGTIHIPGTTFADIKTNGFLSATGKDLTNQISDQQSKLYDAIMYPLAKGIALYSNPDYRPNQSDVDAAMKSYKTQAGEKHAISLGKMAEMKKNFLSVSESYLDSHMLNPAQAKALKDQIKYVQKAIPWSVDDVSNYMKSGKSDTMKFQDFLNSKIPQAAIDKLKADPSLAGKFDETFGSGSSDKYLGK